MKKVKPRGSSHVLGSINRTKKREEARQERMRIAREEREALDQQILQERAAHVLDGAPLIQRDYLRRPKHKNHLSLSTLITLAILGHV